MISSRVSAVLVAAVTAGFLVGAWAASRTWSGPRRCSVQAPRAPVVVALARPDAGSDHEQPHDVSVRVPRRHRARLVVADARLTLPQELVPPRTPDPDPRPLDDVLDPFSGPGWSR